MKEWYGIIMRFEDALNYTRCLFTILNQHRKYLGCYRFTYTIGRLTDLVQSNY